MYDELVKRMRKVEEMLKVAQFKEAANLIEQAADAIEQLCRDLDSMNEANIALYGALPKWIPVTEDTPSDFVSVQAHMTDAGPFPSVREAYTVDGLWFFPALKEFHPVDAWKRFDEPPKEET